MIDNRSGNKEGIVATIEVLKAKAVSVYADLVVHNMANERHNATTFPGDEILSEFRSNAVYCRQQRLYGDLSNVWFSRRDFHEEACIDDYCNAKNVGGIGFVGRALTAGYRTQRHGSGANWVLDQQKQNIRALLVSESRVSPRCSQAHARCYHPLLVLDEIANNSHVR